MNNWPRPKRKGGKIGLGRESRLPKGQQMENLIRILLELNQVIKRVKGQKYAVNRNIR